MKKTKKDLEKELVGARVDFDILNAKLKIKDDTLAALSQEVDDLRLEHAEEKEQFTAHCDQLQYEVGRLTNNYDALRERQLQRRQTLDELRTERDILRRLLLDAMRD